jgi:dCMP deaminase
MRIAEQVRGPMKGADESDSDGTLPPTRGGANCLGSKIGAVIVREDRVISTGYNGTPEGMKNCNEGGCLRCKDREHEKQGRLDRMSDESHVAGSALDRCICVHAEQNALLSAARFGIAVQGATVYTTMSPCFGCLKEAIQAGVTRIVFLELYKMKVSEGLQAQYDLLVEQLRDGDRTNFEPLGGAEPEIAPEAPIGYDEPNAEGPER